MSDLEVFWWNGVYVQNFNTMEFANFLEKNQKAWTSNPSSHIKDYIM
jgi:hypothetical protein